MSKVQILKEEPLPMYELKEELKEIRERDETLGFRCEKTEEYVNQIIKLEKQDYDEIKKQLKELGIIRLKDEDIIKILDTLPNSEEQLKTVLSSSLISLSSEEAKKIIDTIKGIQI